jgi:Fe2+ or Zn2+ uptake regulation protein
MREQIEKRLRQSGLKMTPQRFAVLEYLSSSREHPTADQIGAELNRHFPRASRATIYNALNSLREAGLIREVFLDDATARYDANLEEHHHFICRVCGGLEDIEHERVPAVPAIELASGYQVETYEVVMRGVCAACQPKPVAGTLGNGANGALSRNPDKPISKK